MTSDSSGVRPGSALAALTTSALALPGLAGEALADAPADEASSAYSFSYYREDNLGPGEFVDTTGTGSRDRYEIYAQQFNVVAPITSRIDASFDLVFETMAGASPWWVENGKQVMSAATIQERRVDGQLTLNHYFDRSTVSLTGGVSSEKDYLSGNFGFSGTRSYNDKNTTFALGLGFSWDEISPTDFESFTPGVPHHDKKTLTFDLSISQILYRNAILQLGVTIKNAEGFLSDPYKKVLVQGAAISDQRPDDKNMYTLQARLRHHFPPANGTLHFDTSFYLDTWGTNSLTFDLAWYQTLFEYFRLVPSFRYYSQSQADFYGPVFPSSRPVHRTSDFRLSPYGAISYGLKAEAQIDAWPFDAVDLNASLSYERYLSDGSFGLSAVAVEAPALVKYHLFSILLGARF